MEWWDAIAGGLDAFNAWYGALSPAWTYAVLLLVAYGENVLPPIPGDLLIAYAGLLAGTGAIGLLPVIALAGVGGTLGFMTVYAVGHRLGDAIDDPDRLRWVPNDRIATARRWIGRHGRAVILGNRFIPGVRSVIALAAGASQVGPRTALVLSAVSATVWSALVATLGFFAGDNLEEIERLLRLYGKVAGAVLVAAVAIWLVVWSAQKRHPEA
jgi:membrane protein DedA with SNARE-associated domain